MAAVNGRIEYKISDWASPSFRISSMVGRLFGSRTKIFRQSLAARLAATRYIPGKGTTNLTFFDKQSPDFGNGWWPCCIKLKRRIPNDQDSILTRSSISPLKHSGGRLILVPPRLFTRELPN